MYSAMTRDAIAYANAACLRSILGRNVGYLELEPSPELKADVEYCWTMWASEPLATPLITRSPGKGGVDLVVPIDGNFCENAERHLFGGGPVGAYLVGPLSQPAKLISTGRCTAVGMRFRAGHCRRLFRFPAHELRDRVLSMQAVDQGLARNLMTRVGDQSTPRNQVAALQHALTFAHESGLGEATVRRAIDLIEEHHGSVSIDVVADMTGTSVRSLERQFRDSVGLSPKQFCRIARVRRAAGLLSQGRVRWSEVVHACGYCDQAHFIREFKAIVGVVPSAFLEERKRPCSATG